MLPLPSELKQDVQNKIYLFLNKLSIKEDISSINNLISSIKTLDEKIRKEKDNLGVLTAKRNIPPKLYPLFEEHEYNNIDELNIIRDINSIDNLISSIKILNEKIRKEKDNLGTITAKRNIPSKLYPLFEEHEYNNIDELGLIRDIGLLCIEESFIKKIIKEIFPKHFLNQEYNLFKKYYNLLDQDVQNYFNEHVEFNSKSIKANLELILTFKRLSQIKKQ